MRALPVTILTSSVLAAFLVVGQDTGKPRKGPGNGGSGEGKGGPGGGAEVVSAVVPDYLYNLWLCRPESDSVTLSALAWAEMDGLVEYGNAPDHLDLRAGPFPLTSGVPREIVLKGLSPNTEGFYRWNYRLPGDPSPRQDALRRFHTRRAPGSSFTFTVQADSHLDVSTDVRVYQQTLANMLGDKPDFMIDLGDTTMVDKFGAFYSRAESQYRAQRFYIGRIAHSVPVILTLGNHDGELGSRLTGKPDAMPLWSVGMRKKYFPNPEPGGIYSGNDAPFESAGLLQNYCAWEWGDALFVTLDPFWPTRERKGEENWSMTLGDAQYRWLAKTLVESRAAYKFIFIHHLVGGLGRDVRGGVTAAPFMEWGGKNADGTDGFARHRPGWDLPIHRLLVQHGVSIVFHGHDHLYAKEELDGIVYQEVPQPGHPTGGTRSAAEYGYTGVILGSSGHLRVTVKPGEAAVDYVRSAVEGVTKPGLGNGSVDHHYSVAPRS